MMETALLPVYRFCNNCKFEGETEDRTCPKCRKPMQSKKVVQVLGGLMMFIGFILMGMMGFVIYSINQTISGRNPGSNWNGSPEETKIIMGVLYMVLLTGVSITVTGIWHMITGKRNMLLLIIMFGLIGVLYLAGKILPQMFS